VVIKTQKVPLLTFDMDDTQELRWKKILSDFKTGSIAFWFHSTKGFKSIQLRLIRFAFMFALLLVIFNLFQWKWYKTGQTNRKIITKYEMFERVGWLGITLSLNCLFFRSHFALVYLPIKIPFVYSHLQNSRLAW